MRRAQEASQSASKRRARRAFRAPGLERLEDRSLLSVTLSAMTGPPGEIDLSWTSTNNSGWYQIQSSYNGIDFFNIGKAAPGTTAYSNTGLYYDVSYWYRVVEHNQTGSGTVTSNVASTYTQAALPNPYPIAQDSFNSKAISSAWSFVGGKWTQSNGILSQTGGKTQTDVEKAVLGDQNYPADQAITAKVWVTSWTAGDAARAGVGIDTTPKSGLGYELVFHGNNQVQFLDDGVTWGNAYSFSWNTNTWYWFQLTDQSGTLLGKVWQDGTPEPTNWMFQQTGWTDRTTGNPSLDGGGQTAPSGRFRCCIRLGGRYRDGRAAAAICDRRRSER